MEVIFIGLGDADMGQNFRLLPSTAMKSHILPAFLSSVALSVCIPNSFAAQFTWWGGSGDDLKETNWNIGIGIPVAILFSNSDITTDLFFGQFRDDNSFVKMDDILHVDSLNFSGQNWDVELSSLHMTTGDINVSTTSKVVNLHTDYGMTWGSSLGDGEMTINVDAGSQLNIHGNAYGNGSFNKYGGGTTIITSPFYQERGSRIDGTNLYGGTLITDNPINNYNIREGTLLGFNIPNGYARGDLTFTSRIYGAGNFVKTGDATLILAGDTSYTGTTRVDGGRLIVSASHYFTSGFSFNGGDLELRSTAGSTFDGAVRGSGSFTKSGAGSLRLTGDSNHVGGTVSITGGRLIEHRPMGSRYNLGGSTELLFDNDAAITFSGTISGTGTFLKWGSGDLVLSGANSYTGGTRISGGRLFVEDLRSNYYINVGASLVFSQAAGENSRTFAGGIGGIGTFVKRGNGTLTLTGARLQTSEWGGTFGIEGGRLIDQHFRGNYILGGNNSELELAIGYDVVLASKEFGYSGSTEGTISGTGRFTKSGTGALVLLSPLLYNGPTTINGGSLLITQNNYLPSSTDLTVNQGGSLMMVALRSQSVASLSGSGSIILPSSTLVINNQIDSTFSGIISDQDSSKGVVVKNGSGTQTFSGVNTYGGGTIINHGTLIDRNPHGSYALANNSSLEFANADFVSLNSTNKITGEGRFTKSGSGNLYIETALGYSGGTTIEGGILVAADWNALPTTTDLTIEKNGTYIGGYRTFQTVRSLSGSGNLVLALDCYFTVGGSGNSEFSGEISGGGSLIKIGTGTLRLSGPNTHNGGTFVNGGRLVDENPYGNYTVTNGASLEFSKGGGTTGGLTVNVGTSFLNTTTGPVTIGGRTYNNGRFMTGTGGTTSFLGTVTGAGSFYGRGLVSFAGSYSPGNSIAHITFEGDVSFESTNRLMVEIGLSASDQISVDGEATFGGDLEILLSGGFSPYAGQSYDIFDFGSRVGTFRSVSLPNLSEGLQWDISQLYTTGVIAVMPVPEPGVTAIFGAVSASLLLRRRRAFPAGKE
jgi:fibronectin-binding autotransporter adhesin